MKHKLFIIGLLLGFTLSFVYAFTTYYDNASAGGIMFNRNGQAAATDSLRWVGDSLNIHADINVYGHDIDSIATARMRSLTLDTILLDTASVWFGNQVVYVGAKDNLDSIINNYDGTKLILNLVEDTIYHVNKINLQATDTVCFIGGKHKTFLQIDTISDDWAYLYFDNIVINNDTTFLLMDVYISSNGEKTVYLKNTEWNNIVLVDTCSATILDFPQINFYITGNSDYGWLPNNIIDNNNYIEIGFVWLYNYYSGSFYINKLNYLWVYNSIIENSYFDNVMLQGLVYSSSIKKVNYLKDIECYLSNISSLILHNTIRNKNIFDKCIIDSFFILGALKSDTFLIRNTNINNYIDSIEIDTLRYMSIQNSNIYLSLPTKFKYHKGNIIDSDITCRFETRFEGDTLNIFNSNILNLNDSIGELTGVYFVADECNISNSLIKAEASDSNQLQIILSGIDSLSVFRVYNSIFMGISSYAGYNGIINIEDGRLYFTNCQFIQDTAEADSSTVLIDISSRDNWWQGSNSKRPIVYMDNCYLKSRTGQYIIDAYGGVGVHLRNTTLDGAIVFVHGSYFTADGCRFIESGINGAAYWVNNFSEQCYVNRDTFHVKVFNSYFVSHLGNHFVGGTANRRMWFDNCKFVREGDDNRHGNTSVGVFSRYRGTLPSGNYPDSTGFIKFTNCEFAVKNVIPFSEDSLELQQSFILGFYPNDSISPTYADSSRHDTIVIEHCKFVATTYPQDSLVPIYALRVRTTLDEYKLYDVILRNNEYIGCKVPTVDYEEPWNSAWEDTFSYVIDQHTHITHLYTDTLQSELSWSSYLEVDSLKANNKIITNNIYSLGPSSNYLYINAYRTYINNGALTVIDTTYTNTITLWEKSNGFNSIYRVKEKSGGEALAPSDKNSEILRDYMYTKLNDGGTYNWYDNTYYDRLYYRGIDTAIVGDTDTVPTGYYDRWFYQNIKDDNSQYPQLVMSFDTLGIVQIGKGLNLSYLSVSSIKSSYNLLHSQKFIFMDQYGVLWNKWYSLILPNELIKTFTSGTWGRDNTDIIFIPNWGTWGDNLTTRDFSFNLVSIPYTLIQRGIYGSVLPFDSDSDTIYIDMTNDTINLSYDGIYRGLTFYTWLNNDNISDTSTIFYMRSDTVSATQTIMKLYQKADSICFYITNDGITKDTIKFGDIPSQVWYFVYVIVDSIPLTDSIKVNLGIIRPPTTFGGRVTIDRVTKYLTIPDTLKYETVFFGGGWKGYLGAFGLVRSPYLYAVPVCGINGLQRWFW